MSIDLQNDTIIDNMNNNSLLCGGANYLISTAQDREFLCMYMILPLILVNVFIHYGQQTIPMKFDKELMYFTIW